MMLEVMENIACLSQRGKLVRTHKRYPQSWATPIEATLTLITLRCSLSPVATSKMRSCFTTSTQCEQIVYTSLNSSPSEHDGCCGSTLWARSPRCCRALAVGLCHGGQDTHVHIAISPRCRIPDDHMVSCETDAGVSDTTLSSPASAYCS